MVLVGLRLFDSSGAEKSRRDVASSMLCTGRVKVQTQAKLCRQMTIPHLRSADSVPLTCMVGPRIHAPETHPGSRPLTFGPVCCAFPPASLARCPAQAGYRCPPLRVSPRVPLSPCDSPGRPGIGAEVCQAAMSGQVGVVCVRPFSEVMVELWSGTMTPRASPRTAWPLCLGKEQRRGRVRLARAWGDA